MTPHATHITMRSTKPESASGSSGGLLWRYIALDRGMAKQRGELLAASAADVRASLRRIGLQVIDVRRMHRVRRPISIPGLVGSLGTDLRSWWHTRCRAQRAAHRAEFYDSLATMLSSGLALLEAVQTIVESHVDERGGTGERGSGWGSDRAMFVTVRESLREGQSLAQAMLGHPDWFDAIDIAMVEAAQHSGNLPAVLADLSQRQQRSSEIAHKLTGALAYPLLVMLMGLGVVVFLSVKTLPDLTKILADAGIPIPWLTARVMALGQMLAEHWHWLIVAAAVALLARVMLPRMLGCLPINAPAPPIWVRTIATRLRSPKMFRRMRVGALVEGLAQLLGSGVPMVEALRVLAPTQRSCRLRRVLIDAAERIERGEDLSAALDDPAWFDSEMRRLLDIGQASGELEDMLARIGQRYERRARRLIDRMTTLLEPAVLLLLAVMVGTVVMAAILPLLSLQEILR